MIGMKVHDGGRYVCVFCCCQVFISWKLSMTGWWGWRGSGSTTLVFDLGGFGSSLYLAFEKTDEFAMADHITN